MKPCAVVLCLALIPLTLASEDTWPRKGDKVYISASFKNLSATSPVAGVKLQYNIPPCAEFTILKANPEKSLWVTKDAMNGKEHLGGEWLPHLHKDKAACEAYISLVGEGVAIRTGETFKILPPEPK